MYDLKSAFLSFNLIKSIKIKNKEYKNFSLNTFKGLI